MTSNLLKNWNSVSAITLQFFDNIPDEHYRNKPFGCRFRSFAWEYACLFTTREMYIDGFETGILDGNSKQSDETYIANLSKGEMRKKILESDQKICAVINGEPRTIKYFDEDWDGNEVISYLLQHEQLHFGKLMLYCAQINVPIPDLLKEMWGRMSFKKEG